MNNRVPEQTRLGVSELEILICEALSIDRFTASSISISKVSTLDHKLRNDSVECASLVVERLSLLANTLLTSAQGPKVLSSLGHSLAIQTNDNATCSILEMGLNMNERVQIQAGRVQKTRENE